MAENMQNKVKSKPVLSYTRVAWLAFFIPYLISFNDSRSHRRIHKFIGVTQEKIAVNNKLFLND